MRAPTGTRIEETARLCDLVENSIRQVIPPAKSRASLTTSGCPTAASISAYSNSAPIGTGDADILVSLTPEHHPTAEYVSELRMRLAREFPGVTFYFLPSDMVSQILNFGLPAPINVQVVGPNLAANRRLRRSAFGQAASTFPVPPICAFSRPLTCRTFRSTWIAPERQQVGVHRA